MATMSGHTSWVGSSLSMIVKLNWLHCRQWIRFSVLPSVPTMTTLCLAAVTAVSRWANQILTSFHSRWKNNFFKVWEVATKQCLHTFTDHSDQVLYGLYVGHSIKTWLHHRDNHLVLTKLAKVAYGFLFSYIFPIFIKLTSGPTRFGAWSTTRRATKWSPWATTSPSISTRYLSEIYIVNSSNEFWSFN